MAVIIPSPLVARIEGSIGGTTFRRARSHLTSSAKPRAARARGIMLEQRRQTAKLSHSWLTLTQAQRTAWKKYFQSFQQQSHPYLRRPTTPLQLYLLSNVPRAIAGIATSATPPTYVGIAAQPLSIAYFAAAAAIGIQFQLDNLAAGDWMTLRISRHFSAGVRSPSTWTRLRVLYTGPITTLQYYFPTAPYPSGSNILFTLQRISPSWLPSTPARYIALWP